ncbi:MAG: hypothetical protein R3F11_01100 [Verrucomicrobiales bacterium]
MSAEFIYPTEPGDGAPTATENVGVTAYFRAKPRQGDAVALDAVVDVSEFQDSPRSPPTSNSPYSAAAAPFSGTIQPGDSVLLGGSTEPISRITKTRCSGFSKSAAPELTPGTGGPAHPTRVRSDGKAEVALAE